MRLLTPYWTTRRAATTDIFNEMERFFEDFGRAPAMASAERTYTPACDVSEKDDGFMLCMDLPGFKKEDIKIEMNENVLTISGERKREVKADVEPKGHRIERYYGSFARSFSLPTNVDVEKIEAHYEDGVLNLHIPKTQVAAPRRIEIQSKTDTPSH